MIEMIIPKIIPPIKPATAAMIFSSESAKVKRYNRDMKLLILIKNFLESWHL